VSVPLLLITSKGGAGVAGSAIVVLASTLAATGTIPVASVALILGGASPPVIRLRAG
jgi:aerobic C4-dicarboxylate transport protein